MRNLFEHKTAVFIIAATVVAAIIIGIFGALASGDKATVAENTANAAASGGQSGMSALGNLFSGLFDGFGDTKALREENERLKFENMELDKRLRDAEILEDENAELREMLELQETEAKLDLEAVKVISKDPSNYYSTFVINKGSDDGIEKNQPVITAQKAVIGQVYKVGSDWAEIITVIDPESGVGAMVERTGDMGVVEGDASLRLKGQCKLGYLSRDAEIQPNDYLETSGMGGVYPKGLLIGKVIEVKEDNATMSKYAMVEPIADIERLNQVFVLKSYVEEIKRYEKKSETDDDEEDSKDSKSKKDDDEDEDEDEPKPTSKPKSTEEPESTTEPNAKGGTELRE